MTFGSEGATAIAPTEPLACPSKIGSHVLPVFVVFHTPPFTAAMYKTFAWRGTPVMATVRPPRKGPMQRQRISENNFWSYCCAGAEIAVVSTTRTAAARFLHARNCIRHLLEVQGRITCQRRTCNASCQCL